MAREQGLAEGLAEGRKEGLAKAVSMLAASGMDVSTISGALKISEEECEKYIELEKTL